MEVTSLDRENRFKGHITCNGVLHVFKKCLSDSSNLLDLGAGDGVLIKAIESKYPKMQVTGVDVNPKCDIVIRGDISNIPFEDQTFDCITCTDVIEHLPDEILSVALSEIFRVLKVGGCVLITTLLEEDLTERACLCPSCGHTFHRIGHVQTFTKKDLADRLTGAGFSIIKTKIVHFGLYSYYPILANFFSWLAATKIKIPEQIKALATKDIIIILEKR